MPASAPSVEEGTDAPAASRGACSLVFTTSNGVTNAEVRKAPKTADAIRVTGFGRGGDVDGEAIVRSPNNLWARSCLSIRPPSRT